MIGEASWILQDFIFEGWLEFRWAERGDLMSVMLFVSCVPPVVLSSTPK